MLNEENDKVVDGYLRRRVGQFEICRALVGGSTLSDLMIITKDIFVIRCEYLYKNDSFSYTALSPHFDEIPEVEMTPRYEATITRGKDENEDKTINVKWERVGGPVKVNVVLDAKVLHETLLKGTAS